MALTFLFKADGSQFTRGLEKMRGQTKRWSSSMSKTIATAFASGVVIAGIKKLIDSASSLNETVGKSRVIFGASSASMEAWAETLATSFGISKQEGLEASAQFASMFQILKVGDKDAERMSKSLVELASDMGSFNDKSIEEALLAISSGLRGQNEPLLKFNIMLDAATLKAKALEMGLTDGKGALDLQSKALAAYATIMQQSAVQQGNFGDTSDDLANSLKILAAESENASAAMGNKLLPAMTRIANATKGGSSTIAGWVEDLVLGFSVLTGALTQVFLELIDFADGWRTLMKDIFTLNFSDNTIGKDIAKMIRQAEGASERIRSAFYAAGDDATAGGGAGSGSGGGGKGGAASEAAEKALKERLETAEKIKTAEEELNNAMRSRLSDEKQLMSLQKKRADLVAQLIKDAAKGSKEELANIKLNTRIAQVGNQAIAINKKIINDQNKEREKKADIKADEEKIRSEAAAVITAGAAATPETNVIASSLASIGGGGNVASFTSDPVLAASIEANKILLEIKNNTKPTPATPTIPEI